jgi:hypothetical protein
MSRNGCGAVRQPGVEGTAEAKRGRHHCQVRDVTIDVEFQRWFFLRINMNSLYYDGNMRGVAVIVF